MVHRLLRGATAKRVQGNVVDITRGHHAGIAAGVFEKPPAKGCARCLVQQSARRRYRSSTGDFNDIEDSEP